jgi:benzoyl-CoA reductase subunit A
VKCAIGIDLGSTTTKAIILSEEGQIVGRGLTNSRSDYTVAARIAQGEAYTNARFQLLGSVLHAEADSGTSGFLKRLHARFRFEQIHEHYRSLRELCLTELSERDPGEEARETAAEIFANMDRKLGEHIESFGDDESLFFRDVAGSLYMREAEEVCRKRHTSFDSFVGLYDKAILLVENQLLDQSFRDCAEAALSAVIEEGQDEASFSEAIAEVSEVEFDVLATIGTGYGRLTLPFEKEQISSEILCHGLGAHFMFPGTRTVLDIGGQDMKAIQVDENGIVDSFQMNDRCAAGTGRYLGYIADELNLGLHQLGPMASQSSRPTKISSTCTVFAGTEFREKLALGHRREDILAGLHRAIILRAMSLLARSGGIRQEFTFTGGVAKNEAAVAELRKLVHENYGEDIVLNIHSDSIYTGAVGAALFALRQSRSKGEAA